MEVNFLDLIIAIPIVLLAIMGFRNGFIKEIASIVALILGLYFAINFSEWVANYLNDYLDMGHRWLFILAFILTFVIVVALVSLIGKLLNKIASLAALGIINRIVGMLFGIVKGVVIMSVLIMLFAMIDSRTSILKKEVQEGSLLYEPVEKVAPFILKNLQNVTYDDPSWDKFRQASIFNLRINSYKPYHLQKTLTENTELESLPTLPYSNCDFQEKNWKPALSV